MKKNITKILVIITVITVCIGAKVYADYIMNATEVEYTKSDSTKVSVKAALDDLYNKSQELNEIDIVNIQKSTLSGLEFSNSSIGLKYTGSKIITITNPNNYEITVESSDSTIATVTKNSNTQVTIDAKSKEGAAVITAKVTVDNTTLVVKKIGVGVWSGSGTMTISTAKTIITPENISAFQGTAVSYSPSGGGTWRIFYYDEAGKYGDGAGTLYLKRDYNSSTKVKFSSYEAYYKNSSSKSDVLADMKKFNPQWSSGDGTIDANSDNVASYLCYHGAWTTYLDDSVAQYAIGSPSTEMYIDAWNQYNGRRVLDYKWVKSSTSLYETYASNNGYAYAPAFNSPSITKFGSTSPYYSLTTEANSMFMTSGGSWWLASPSVIGYNYLCYIDSISSNRYLSGGSDSSNYGVCPVVSLGN
ncbi:MAG: hypothetical protein IJ809_01510 [Clostridia bacterium]|nr:hypothetical protein [Clostridia bacterium]